MAFASAECCCPPSDPPPPCPCCCLPDTLIATVSEDTAISLNPCSCASEQITLTRDPETDIWHGSGNFCGEISGTGTGGPTPQSGTGTGGPAFVIAMKCFIFAETFGYVMTMEWDCDFTPPYDTFDNGAGALPQVCDPPYLRFDFKGFESDCCSGDLLGIIVEVTL